MVHAASQCCISCPPDYPQIFAIVSSDRDVSWLDFEYYPFFSGCAPWVLVLANVFLSKLVDVCVSAFEHLRYYVPSDHNLVVHVVLIGNGDCNARIPGNILLFPSSHRSVYEYSVAFMINPDRRHVR